MKKVALLSILAPILTSCSQPYAIRFPDRAFPTRPGQKVLITTLRGRTEIRGVIGSRDIVVRGTVETLASSPERAVAQAEAVKVIDTSVPDKESILRLEVVGIPVSSDARLNAEFLVPKDIRLEVHDGPEDLSATELEGGIVILDGAGNIAITDIALPVEIVDQDGDIAVTGVKGSVKIDDRRGDIIVEEITGDIDIADREGDTLIESVTGNVALAKQGRGNVRIRNLDGNWFIKEWLDNPTKPIIDTIWPQDAETSVPPAKAAPRKEGSAVPPGADKKDGGGENPAREEL